MNVDFALAVAGRGYRVFPVGAKKPQIKGWPELATRDEKAIRAWWVRFPGSRVGIATGLGLVVIDLDIKGGKHGVREFTDWAVANGVEWTPTLTTPSGGQHVYFMTSEHFSNTVSRVLPGVDIRSLGGYVVAHSLPPVLAELPELPAVGAQLLRPTVERSTYVDDSRQRPVAEGVHPWAARGIDGELARLDNCADRWEVTTFEVACNLIEFANSNWSGYSIDQAEADLMRCAPDDTGAVRHGDEGFGPAEHAAKWRSALNTVGSKGRQPPPGPSSAADDFAVLVEGDDPTRPELFADVALFLSGDAPTAPARIAGRRTDDECLFYEGQVNLLFGDPESGKTWIALGSAADALSEGRRVACLDMDHNGLAAIVGRLRLLGAPVEALTDRSLFRYIEPDDSAHLSSAMAALVLWAPGVAVVDSVGELLPLLGLSSNSPDDFTMAHAAALKPLAMAGAAVIAIDHLAKNTASRESGPTGTAAKRRAVGGVALRVQLRRTFTPGKGGACAVLINKDRHGGLRAATPISKGEAFAGMFVMDVDELGITTWRITAPSGEGTDSDVALLAQLDPPPSGIADVKKRMGWGQSRATGALDEWKGCQ